MKVLNVADALGRRYRGGTGERTLLLSRYLVHVGIECSIVTLDMGGLQEFKTSSLGFDFIKLPWCNKKFSVRLSSLRKIKHCIKTSDIIHIISHWTLINAIVYIYARQLNKPYVVCPAGSLSIQGRKKILKYLYDCWN